MGRGQSVVGPSVGRTLLSDAGDLAFDFAFDFDFAVAFDFAFDAAVPFAPISLQAFRCRCARAKATSKAADRSVRPTLAPLPRPPPTGPG